MYDRVTVWGGDFRFGLELWRTENVGGERFGQMRDGAVHQSTQVLSAGPLKDRLVCFFRLEAIARGAAVMP